MSRPYSDGDIKRDIPGPVLQVIDGDDPGSIFKVILNVDKQRDNPGSILKVNI